MAILLDFVFPHPHLNGEGDGDHDAWFEVRVIVQAAGRLHCVVDTIGLEGDKNNCHCTWQPANMASDIDLRLSCNFVTELVCVRGSKGQLEMEESLRTTGFSGLENNGLAVKSIVVEFVEEELDTGTDLPFYYCNHMPRKERFMYLADSYCSNFVPRQDANTIEVGAV
jgi:hypothetical protein